MSFRRKDFHNGRVYEADPPGPGPISSAIAWVKLQLDKMLRTGASSSISPAMQMPADERSYSLLGSDARDVPPEGLDSTAFPMADRDSGFRAPLQ